MDKPAVVQRVDKHVDRATTLVTNITTHSDGYRQGRAPEKQKMDIVCLENMWGTKLRCMGWSVRAAKQTIHSLADSTIRTYQSYIQKYVTFCDSKSEHFAKNDSDAIIADFLCNVADKSERPESAIKISIASTNLLFHVLGKQSPARSRDIQHFVTALIKTGTKSPMVRNKPMPIQPFVNLFESMGPNEQLTLRDLRMKAVVLLSLCAMTRPSDIAPKAKLFNTEKMEVLPVSMKANDIVFEKDKSMTIVFHGIKNDTNRQGFEVNIPRNTKNESCDPVQCLKAYIETTNVFRSADMVDLILTLTAPYRALKADTVARVLEEGIKRAGLEGFNAKSFRPTGATMAVSMGILPETIMKIGRWKSREVFMNHYVYGKVPESYTGDLLDTQV